MQDIVIHQHQNLTSDDMGGLEPKLFLGLGSRVMPTRNLRTEKSLCNV